MGTALNLMDIFLRVVEHIPILGHLLALLYIPLGHKQLVGRAIVKATLGFVIPINFLIEIIDELVRKRTKPKKDNELSHRPKWMYQFHRKRLHHLVLPGSHNSATSSFHKKTTILPLERAWSRCQVLSIAEQLMGGIRFLDLKILYDQKSSDVWVYSSDVLCIRLSEVFQQVQSFVMTFSTEIVCIYITSGGKPIDWDEVNQTTNRFLGSVLVTTDMTDMSIGDIVASGKNVAIFGVPDIPNVWELIYLWPDVTWPAELRKNVADTIHRPFIVPDPPALNWYFGVCKTSLTMKIRELGGLQGVIASRWADEKFTFRLGLARAANREMWNVLQHVNKTSFNVITTDCVDDDIVEKVISCNSKSNSGYAYVMNKIGEIEEIAMSSLEENELERMRHEGDKLKREVCYQSLIADKSFESHV